MIRAYQPSDLDALYDICLDTGNGGLGARHLFDDPRLLGHAYVGPYVAFEPDLAFVVEDDHGVPVEVVCVGDAPLTDDSRPIVLAAREAIANAARHSGASLVDVYAEATPAGIEVFVRDRGAGFDLDDIAADRQGIRSSIQGRMDRHGGTATVRSTPGEGSEFTLVFPSHASAA